MSIFGGFQPLYLLKVTIFDLNENPIFNQDYNDSSDIESIDSDIIRELYREMVKINFPESKAREKRGNRAGDGENSYENIVYFLSDELKKSPNQIKEEFSNKTLVEMVTYYTKRMEERKKLTKKG